MIRGLFNEPQSRCFALHVGNSDIYCFTVPLGSIPELPAQSCQEIKLSEGKDTVSNMYWLDESGKGNAVLDYCDMAISGKTLKKLNKMIFSLEALFFSPCMRLVIPYFPSSSLILSFQAEFLFPVRRYGRTKGTAFLLTHRDREICQSEKSAVFLHKTHYRTPDTSESGSKIWQNPSNVTLA